MLFETKGTTAVLVAYLDELGHVGPYISTEHKKFNHNPIFGYGGIVLPESRIRRFGAKFEHTKARQFRNEIIPSGKHPRRWEKKGSEIFSTGAYVKYPERVDLAADLADYLHKLGGHVVFYGHRKPFGTTKETGRTPSETTTLSLTETVRRLCRYADKRDQSLMVLLDRGGPMPREEAITAMASFIYSSEEQSVKRIVEVPVELESHRYGSMQYADWICSILSRASHFHFSDSTEFSWAPPVLEGIIGGRVMPGSRIWIPEHKWAVTEKALVQPGKWIESSKAKSLSGARSEHLTQSVRDAIRA